MNILGVNAGSSSLRLALFERQGKDLVRLHHPRHEAAGIADRASLAQIP